MRNDRLRDAMQSSDVTAIELAESRTRTAREAAIREVEEETGISVEITGISGIYSDPRHVIAYDDGEVRQEFSIVFHGRPIGGALRSSNESRHAVWVNPTDVPNLKIDRSMRLRIEHGLESRPEPFLS
jgi:8-oxo-dGTP pyrophosphatase MutT (NUDIX family)